jgi:hypothetical protein
MDNSKELDILGRIAESYSEDSEEYAALKTAANALFFLQRDKIRTQFQDFIQNHNRPLNGYELIQLKYYGLDLPEEQRTQVILELEAEMDRLVDKLKKLKG